MCHSLAKALLFFSAGIIQNQYEELENDKIKNLLKYQPVAAGGFITGALVVIGTPLFPIFYSKIGILLSTGSFSLLFTFITALLFVLVAAAFIYSILKMTAQKDDAAAEIKNIPFSMKAPVFISIIMLLVFGILPFLIKGVLMSILNELQL